MQPLLVLNCGSSSLKWSLYDVASRQLNLVGEGQISGIGGASVDHHQHAGQQPQLRSLGPVDLRTAVHLVLELLGAKLNLQDLAAVGHRIVHGGSCGVRATRLTPEILEELERYNGLAPLHQPPALEVIRICQTQLGYQVPMVGVFDTAFPSQSLAQARQYAIPRAWQEAYGVLRYGFHGLAHESIYTRWMKREPQTTAESRVITLQLGSGCSAAAIRGGRCLDTTMGWSPLEGLMMATRSGDVDPALIPYLAQQTGQTAAEIVQALNTQSGWFGVSGRTKDFRELQAFAAAGDTQAQLAIEMFVYRVQKAVGAYAAVLQGIDAILFGGGIGESSADVRERVCQPFGFLGLELDNQANASYAGGIATISRPQSRVQVAVVPPEEQYMIAKATWEVTSVGSDGVG